MRSDCIGRSGDVVVSDASPSSCSTAPPYGAPPVDAAGGIVQICINDVSVDGLDGCCDDDIEDEEEVNLEAMRRGQKRRLSWCPENERKREEKGETQKMLGIGGRSQSLSSLDGHEDNDGEEEQQQQDDGSRANRNDGSNADELSNCPDAPSPVSANGHKTSDRSPPQQIDNDIGPGHQTQRLLAARRAVRNAAGEPKSLSVFYHDSLLNDETDASADVPSFGLLPDPRPPQRDRSRSVIELVSEQGMLEQLDNTLKKYKVKEEKPSRRDSVFSKISSYRQKWINDKSAKSFKNTHHFVPVSFSNSTSCDVCGKPLSNKAALQCENCTVNVHENSCKDQITVCPRINKHALVNSQSMKDRKNNTPSPTGSPSSLRGTQSLRESFLTGPLLLQVKISDDSATSTKQSSTTSGTSSIDEVHCGEDVVDGLTQHTASLESLEFLWSKVADLADDDEDLNLLPKDEEPQAWSVTVDMKTLKRMNNKDIKRQHHIWEFIQTEKRHYRTLKIMQKVFAQSMITHVGIPVSTVDQMFPSLDALLDIHRIFLRSFNQCQAVRVDHSIEEMGDLLIQQFDGQMGVRMKRAYGDFCSRHTEAVSIYKELFKNDRKFQNFIAKCSRNSLCNRLGIPECILLVTQRLTKYPLLIESIIKTTRETNVRERELLSRSLSLIQDILKFINRQIESREKEQRLADIYRRFDSKACATFRGEKFQKSDLIANRRKLRHETSIKWMSARGKPAEVIAVILSDVMVFLSEYNQKYTFFSQDNKSSIISLSKLLVREKGDTKDSKGVYLICPSKTEPEMYELVCRSMDERRQWISILRDAISKRSREDTTGRLIDSDDDELLLYEVQSTKLGHYIEELHEKDRLIQVTCDEKIRVIQDIFDAASGRDRQSWRCEADDESPDNLPLCSLLQLVSRTETQLLESLYLSTTEPDYFTADCATDEDKCRGLLTQPKRADTFSGFDCRPKSTTVVRRRFASGCNEEGETGGSRHSLENELQTAVGNQLGMSLSVSNNRTQRRASICVITTTSDEDAEESGEDARGRRMSANLEQSLHGISSCSASAVDDADSSEIGCSLRQSHNEPARLVDTASSNVAQLSTQQAELLSSLLQHVHSLGECALEKSTETECLRAQLTEARCLIAKLNAENERLLHERRPGGYHLDKQLEDLRQLQALIQQEKAELGRIKERQQQELRQEREALKRSEDMLDVQKAEIKAQKDELQRQRDTLQRQIDLFEKQRRTARHCRAESADRRISPPVCAFDRANLERCESPLTRAQSGTCLIQPFQFVGDDRSPTDAICHAIPTALIASNLADGRLLSRTGSAGNLGFEGAVSRREGQPPSTKPPGATYPSTQPGAVSGTDKAGSIVQQLIPMKLSSLVGASSTRLSAASMTAANTIRQDLVAERSELVVGSANSKTTPEATSWLQQQQQQQSPMKTGRPNTVYSVPSRSHGNILPMKLAEGRGGSSSGCSSKSSTSSSSSNGSGTLSPPITLSPTTGIIPRHSGPGDVLAASSGTADNQTTAKKTTVRATGNIYYV